jgi:hypothetical protein
MTQTFLRLDTVTIEGKENIIEVLNRKNEVTTSPVVLKRPLSVVNLKERANKFSAQEYVSPLKKRKTARLLIRQLSPPSSPTSSSTGVFTYKQEELEKEIRLQQENISEKDENMTVSNTSEDVAEDDETEDDDEDTNSVEEEEDEDDADDDEEDEEADNLSSRRVVRPVHANKVYDSVKGTTCHQCKVCFKIYK